MIKKLKEEYSLKKEEIKKRLDDFSKVKDNDKESFYELCFCVLTPQSNAFKCDDAVKELKKINFHKADAKNSIIQKILKKRTRFYKNKSGYLNEMKSKCDGINKELEDLKIEKKKSADVREYLVKNVKGLGLKEASHFLRNIGYRDLAILDRHIMKNLVKLNVINEVPSTLTPKRYYEIEEKFIKFSKTVKIPIDELDLLFWSMETGKVFK